MTSPQIFAFARVTGSEDRRNVFQEIKNGKSRFGMWEQTKSLEEEWFGKHQMLRQIKPGDWIVHINMPEYGKCVSVQATGSYSFDDGIGSERGKDFNNFIPVDPDTIVKFNRRDPNVIQ